MSRLLSSLSKATSFSPTYHWNRKYKCGILLKYRFSRDEKNVLHFFTCGRQVDFQGVEVPFRTEEADACGFFVKLRMTREELKNITVSCANKIIELTAEAL